MSDERVLNIKDLDITFDLSMVKYISDRIGVLHLGHLLETGTTEEISKIQCIRIHEVFFLQFRHRIRRWRRTVWLRLMITRLRELIIKRGLISTLVVRIM